jgi:hypothetical protein
MHRVRKAVTDFTLLSAVAVAGVFVGCQAPAPQPIQPRQDINARVDNPAAGTVERPSALSYGSVNATVKKNVTSQSDLLNLFGGPNISTTDAEGVETWVYERTSSMTDTAGGNESRDFAAFFGAGGSFGPAVVGGGAGGGSHSGTDQRRTVNSVRTLTVVVKFNGDKTVKDVSSRASYF